MKRILTLVMCVILALLVGCSANEAKPWLADNEIFTYDRVDKDKTVITVSRTGNIFLDGLCDAFELKNPDVQVILLDITGGNNGYNPPIDWLKNGCAPDIMTLTTGYLDDGTVKEYFENLSNKPYISAYDNAALERTAIDGDIYWLPGTSKIDAMMYNKTLFEQYGWSVPKTFDEFVALCVKITEDTDGEIVPWNPNAKYSDELLKALEAFTYEEAFAGVDNREWYYKFINGEEKLTGHIEPVYVAIEKLVNNGLLNEDFYSYSATTRGKEFETGKIAMINHSVSKINGDYEFGYMPFPTTQGEVGYVLGEYSSLFGVVKDEARSKEEKDAVERFLAFLSTPEGQLAYMGDSLMVSNVKGTPSGGGDILLELNEAIDKGHTFALLKFTSELGKANFSFGGDALKILKGERTAEECIAAADADPFVFKDSEPPLEVLATATDDFTILETSEFIADMYRETTGADIGLITDHLAYRGNLMRIFKGGINDSIITTLKPRSLANGSTLVKLSMTGRQLLDALNAPMTNSEADKECLYAFSGLKCKVAPWNKLGEKYLLVALADGSAIEPDKLYTVAAWEGTVRDEFITETLQAYEGTFEDVLRAKLIAAGEITPPRDGRIELVWE